MEKSIWLAKHSLLRSFWYPVCTQLFLDDNRSRCYLRLLQGKGKLDFQTLAKAETSQGQLTQPALLISFISPWIASHLLSVSAPSPVISISHVTEREPQNSWKKIGKPCQYQLTSEKGRSVKCECFSPDFKSCKAHSEPLALHLSLLRKKEYACSNAWRLKPYVNIHGLVYCRKVLFPFLGITLAQFFTCGAYQRIGGMVKFKYSK